MRIAKYGHCCLLIEVDGVKLLTDPGEYSTGFAELAGIAAVLITHEHRDHLHVESLQQVIAINSGVRVLTNRGVGALLKEAGIDFELVEDGGREVVGGVVVDGLGEEHASIYPPEVPQVVNTGYFVADRLWYPGDSFYDPKREVEILALPIAGPWMKISEAFDYAKALKPRVAFPVHDGMLQFTRPEHVMPAAIMERAGIAWQVLEAEKPIDL